MRKNKLLSIFILLILFACERATQEDKNVRKPSYISTKTIKESENKKDTLDFITPIEHGSFAIELNHKKIYIDPMGNSMLYADQKPADIIVITHYHPDYLVPGGIENLSHEKTKLIIPTSVEEILPGELKEKSIALKPDQDTTIAEIDFKSIGFPNAEKSRLKENGFHIKTKKINILISGKNQYLSEIPMIKNLDVLLIKMKLQEEKALEKTIEELVRLNPKQIYPYYYDGIFTYNYVARLKHKIENRNPKSEVKILNWYKNQLN